VIAFGMRGAAGGLIRHAVNAAAGSLAALHGRSAVSGGVSVDAERATAAGSAARRISMVRIASAGIGAGNGSPIIRSADGIRFAKVAVSGSA